MLHFPLPNQLCPVTVFYPCVPLRQGVGEGLSDADKRSFTLIDLNLPANRTQLRTINREYLSGHSLLHVHVPDIIHGPSLGPYHCPVLSTETGSWEARSNLECFAERAEVELAIESTWQPPWGWKVEH